MTKQHLIALDLDGTLLTDDKTISPRTHETLSKAKQAGHIVVISTGRPFQASVQYYDALQLDTPIINFNGALIHHPTNPNWKTIHSPMPKETALKIVKTCHRLDVLNIMAEVQDHIYLDQYDEAILDLFKKTRNDPPFTIGSLNNELQEDPTSLLIHPRDNQISTLRQQLDDYHAELIEHRKWGAPWNIIEIVKKGMNKAIGLETVANHYHLPTEQIIAFGDEDNDLEMLKYAGVGVAMGNAIDELKACANTVTKTNEQDGVSHFLEEYLALP